MEGVSTMARRINLYSELDKRRELRNSAAEAEVRLWQRLKGSQVAGCKFRRQVGVGVYVLDFYCPARKLAIELDGGSHDGDEAQAYDAERQRYIETLNIRFLRFTNSDIYDNLEDVLIAIERFMIDEESDTFR